MLAITESIWGPSEYQVTRTINPVVTYGRGRLAGGVSVDKRYWFKPNENDPSEREITPLMRQKYDDTIPFKEKLQRFGKSLPFMLGAGGLGALGGLAVAGPFGAAYGGAMGAISAGAAADSYWNHKNLNDTVRAYREGKIK